MKRKKRKRKKNEICVKEMKLRKIKVEGRKHVTRRKKKNVTRE